MMQVLKSLMDKLPGRGAAIAAAEAPATPKDDLPITEFSASEPVAEEAAPAAPPPAGPRRMMVDPADIAAAAEPDPIPPEEAPVSAADLDLDLEALVLEAIKVVRDPEIPVNLVDLGLIYDLTVRKGGSVSIEMTLTTPHCPSAAELPGEIEAAARTVEGIHDVKVKVVFSPPWHQGMMSEEARLELNLM